eukprot:CAMPEP_0185797556 /NCGR_PEP_ID=MMETSP1174-20130828/161679_1 /TAXON_ID=35687 /ORGANISM="Dictyocha speculum, Strain CCMP1381" /LENGTH=124 /DNA_ID=CAMNT_0028492997 /DNA_START=792 /DNA_END=1167 /DNA_ORIENTATION=+
MRHSEPIYGAIPDDTHAIAPSDLGTKVHARHNPRMSRHSSVGVVLPPQTDKELEPAREQNDIPGLHILHSNYIAAPYQRLDLFTNALKHASSSNRFAHTAPPINSTSATSDLRSYTRGKSDLKE